MLNRDVDIARIQAQRATESRDEDLKKEVEMKRAAAELERLRATDVVKASIQREATQQAADASAYRTRQEAEADAHANGVSAGATLAATLKQAEGLSAMAEAYASMGRAFGGPQGLLQYLMIEKGTYVELARANAEAIRGLEPKISVWSTGASDGAGTGDAGGRGGAQDPTATLRNVYQMLPPLMTTINDQTGITLPEWQFGRMPEALANKENRDFEKRQPNGQ